MDSHEIDQAVTPRAGESDGSRTDRRAFLARASALALAIPGAGAALIACAPEQVKPADTAKAKAPTTQAGGAPLPNSDSRLDSAVVKSESAVGSGPRTSSPRTQLAYQQ